MGPFKFSNGSDVWLAVTVGVFILYLMIALSGRSARNEATILRLLEKGFTVQQARCAVYGQNCENACPIVK